MVLFLVKVMLWQLDFLVRAGLAILTNDNVLPEVFLVASCSEMLTLQIPCQCFVQSLLVILIMVDETIEDVD